MRAGYRWLIIVLMVIAPIVNVLIGLSAKGWAGDPWPIIGNAFVFWGVGVRLFSAGLSQIMRPQFTSASLLGAKNAGADQVVQELGFANVAIGTVGLVATLWLSGWTAAAALAGCIFLGFAGFRHVAKRGKNANELVETYTDIFVAVVLAIYLIVTLASALQH